MYDYVKSETAETSILCSQSPLSNSCQQWYLAKSREQGQHIATSALYILPVSSKFWLKNSLYNTAAEMHHVASDLCFFQDCTGLVLKLTWSSSTHWILRKGTPELDCALHKGAVSSLHFEPATCLPWTCAVWFQQRVSGLSCKLRQRKLCLQTQQC